MPKAKALNCTDYMTRSFLAGKKTQVRLPAHVTDNGCKPGFVAPFAGFTPRSVAEHLSYAPHKVGGLLYVRETWDTPEYPYPGYKKDRPVVITYRADLSARIRVYPQTLVSLHNIEDWDWHSFKWKSPTLMPQWASRITLEVTNVKLEPVRDISPGDALAEGFDLEYCVAVFGQAAGRRKMKPSRYLEDSQGKDLQLDWCVSCIGKAAREEKATIRSNDQEEECDLPPRCESCDTLLNHALTKYGIEQELFSIPPDSVYGDDALILENIAAYPNLLTEKDRGRLAQIAYLTWWDRRFGKSRFSLADNPWVWVYTMKKVQNG